MRRGRSPKRRRRRRRRPRSSRRSSRTTSTLCDRERDGWRLPDRSPGVWRRRCRRSSPPSEAVGSRRARCAARCPSSALRQAGAAVAGLTRSRRCGCAAADRRSRADGTHRRPLRTGFPPSETLAKPSFPRRRESIAQRSFPRRRESIAQRSFPRRRESSARPSFPRRRESSARPSFPRRRESSARPSFPRRRESRGGAPQLEIYASSLHLSPAT